MVVKAGSELDKLTTAEVESIAEMSPIGHLWAMKSDIDYLETLILKDDEGFEGKGDLADVEEALQRLDRIRNQLDQATYFCHAKIKRQKRRGLYEACGLPMDDERSQE